MSIKTPKVNKTEMVSIRFSPDTLRRIEVMAKSEEIPVATLIRKWALQRLASEAPLPPDDAWVHRTVELSDD